MERNSSARPLVLIAFGSVIFGILMALRQEVALPAGRHALAALAFVLGAAFFAYALKQRPL